MKVFLETKLCKRSLIKGINTLTVTLCKILGFILTSDNGGTQRNGLEDKNVVNDCSRPFHRTENN